MNNFDASQSDLLVAICQAASSEPEAAPCAGDELLELLSQAADEQEEAEAKAQAQLKAEAAEAAAKKLEESLEQAVAEEPELSEWAKFIQAKANAPIVALTGPAPIVGGKAHKTTIARGPPLPPHPKTPPGPPPLKARTKTPEKRAKAPVTKNKLKKMSLAEMQKRSMKMRQIPINENQWDVDQDYVTGA